MVFLDAWETLVATADAERRAATVSTSRRCFTRCTPA